MSVVKTIRKIAGLLCYVAVSCVLTLTVYAMVGGLVLALLQETGMKTEIAKAISFCTFPLVAFAVSKFAIRDYRRRSAEL